MLSFGKYQTSQISSNISYVKRIYAQNFLAYSSIDDLLIFIEPKHQIHVYSGRTIEHIVNLTSKDVVIATSCASLLSDSHHELFFIYETNSKTNLISLRVCQVLFNRSKLAFENNLCIETITFQYDQPDLVINGFTIKRDHAGTKKSLLFISTRVGVIYTAFDTLTGSLFGQPMIMNETLNEGSIALSSSGSIYYASKEEHLIYELKISRDFRLHYGKIIKANAIKYPFGLITDECNHLYIATRSMVLVMFVQTYSTIRSVFSKASDLPITLERLNATTYVYATMKRNARNIPSYWMFNFLYFTGNSPRLSVNLEENMDFNNSITDNTTIPILWPISYTLSSTTNITKKYTQFFSTPRISSSRFTTTMSNYQQKNNAIDEEISSINQTKLFTGDSSTVSYISFLSDEPQPSDLDDNYQFLDNTQLDSQEQKNQSLEKKSQSDTPLLRKTSPDTQLLSSSPSESIIVKDDLRSTTEKGENLLLHEVTQSQDYKSKRPPPDSEHFNRTIYTEEILLSDNDLRSFLEGRTNLSNNQKARIEAYLSKHSAFNRSASLKYITSTKLPVHKYTLDDNLYPDYKSEDTQLQDHDSKTPSNDSNALNYTIDQEQIPFSDHDLRSFLEDRANFTKSQKAKIQAYINQQLSLNRSAFSKYTTSTKLPITKYTLDNKTNFYYQRNTTKSPGYHTETLLSDVKDFNHTIDTEIMFSDDDVQSFLEGRANFSKEQKAKIEAYLNKQSSANRSAFSKYLTSTKLPTTINASLDNVYSDHGIEDIRSQDYDSKIPLSDSKNLNRTKDTEGISFSDDDLRSFLEDPSNFTKSQKEKIQAYLNKQSSTSRSESFKSLPSTKLPTTKYTYHDSKKSHFDNHDTQPQDYLTKTPLSDSKDFNPTIDTEIFFSDDDLQSFLEGRANFSNNQKEQIETYLNKQSSTNRSAFSKYLTSTKLPATIYASLDNEYPDYSSEDIQLQDYDSKIPLSDSKTLNRSKDKERILFSDDDVRSFLEGRANFSKKQKAQIEAYLRTRLSSNRSASLNYSTSTKLPGRKYTSIDNRYPEYESGNTQSHSYLTKTPLFDSKDLNRTIDTENILFSDDDLRSFIEGRSNLSNNQKEQIEAYLNKQSSTNRSAFSKYLTSTTLPITKYAPLHNVYPDYAGEEIQLQDYDSKIPLSDSKIFNRSKDEERILFSDDDVRFFLEGRSNFSKKQKAQIEAYLRTRLSSNRSASLNHSTSTKLPGRKYIPTDNAYLDYESGNTQPHSYLTTTPLFDSKAFNRTIDREKILFSDDDLRSFLEGRANLSENQKAKIEAYLSKQLSSNRSISSKFPASTKFPGKKYTHDENVHADYESEDTQLQDYELEIPLSDWNDFNRTLHEDGIPLSLDDLRSFLEGRANLSKKQKAHIRAYLSKQPSRSHDIFLKYSTSTKLPSRKYPADDNLYRDDQIDSMQSQSDVPRTPLFHSKDFNRTIDREEILFSDDDLRSFLEGRANLSRNQKAQIEAYLSEQASSNRSTSSKYSTRTKLPDVKFTLDDGLKSDDESDDTQSNGYVTKRPLSDSKDFNHTIDEEGILFSDDDLRSFFDGRANLSNNQKTQIEAYL
ncbi:unnamed protein product, partial [Rotaria sp. Silwood2]